MPLPSRGLLRPTRPVLGANIKIFREKVILYTKLKKNISTFKNVTMARYIRAQERTKNRDTSVGITAKLFSMPQLDLAVKPKTRLLSLNVTTNRGTCGALNSRQAQNLQYLIGAGYNVRAIPYGRKGTDSFAALIPENISASIVVETDHVPSNAHLLAELLYENSDWDVCRVGFTRWLSVARQEWSYVPIPSYERFKELVEGSANLPEAAKGSVNNARLLNTLIGFDEENLRAFWEFHVATAINFAIEENQLSELAARIVAVENQLQNISKLRDWAQRMYNKTRQASVTAELLELSGASAAMEGITAEEEAARVRAGKKTVMSDVDRAEWLTKVDKALLDLRFQLALAESSGKTASLDTLRARIAKFVKWRAFLACDETSPPPGIDMVELHKFLSTFGDTWAADRFAEMYESLRGTKPATESVAVQSVAALAAK